MLVRWGFPAQRNQTQLVATPRTQVPALSSLARLRKQFARPGFDLGGLLFSQSKHP